MSHRVLSLCLFLLCSYCGNCEKLTPVEIGGRSPTIPTCMKNITRNYLAELKNVVYVNMDPETNELLKMVHSMGITSVTTKTATSNVLRFNLAYLIVVYDVLTFLQNISSVSKEPSWNPYARFLVIIRSLEKRQLFRVFDVFLTLHVINAVVVNATDTAELYTYNPYENFACGKYYTRLIEYGKCLEVTADIYPQKVTTGLRNCFFNVSVPHWPPYGIDPSKVEDGNNIIGTDQYVFSLISEIEHFTYKFHFNYDPEVFSEVTNDMTVTGPMLDLANNHTDVMLGGLMLIPSRARLFFYVFGYLDYVDELRLLVKRAGPSPAWQDVYREFAPIVWFSLFIVFTFYSTILTILLKAKDGGRVVLTLLDNLLSHGTSFRCRRTIKCIFFMWVLFAYLINSFYTTILMSFTTKPSLSFQIKNEENLKDFAVEPCVSSVMNKFLKSQSLHEVQVGPKGCHKLLDSIKSVSESRHQFTLVLYSLYLYNKHQFYDEFGQSPIYSFKKPYAKVIYAMYFHSGFPLYERLHVVALRIREVGLSEKSLNDLFYNQTLKYHFRSRGFEARFAVPWYLYAIGLCISFTTLMVELAFHNMHKKYKQLAMQN